MELGTPFKSQTGSSGEFIQELRELHGQQEDALWENLINSAFPVPPGASFYDDFPVWNPALSRGIKKWGAFAHGQLAATASIRKCELKVPGGLVPVAIIGAVATDPKFRGSGLASQMVSRACDVAKAQGAALICLWGSETGLYEKLGFTLAGQQARIALSEMPLPDLPVHFRTGWVPGLFGLMLRRDLGLQVLESDRTWLGSHKNVLWYWSGDAAAPSAYVAIGRGIDLPNIIHEWGGEKRALSSLLGSLKLVAPDFQLLYPPSRATELGIPATLVRPEPVCMMKVLDSVRAESVIKNQALWFWGLDGA